MHACLYVEDILNLIFDHFVVLNSIGAILGDHVATLHALALCCKAFVDPALDHLWRIQWGIENLIRVLPADLWEIVKEKNRLVFTVPTVMLPDSNCLVRDFLF